MTKYLDEYNPNSKAVNFRVQSDSKKLKFNNIQSCMAVVLVPSGGQSLVGVHLTTKTTGTESELKTAMKELKTAIAGATCDGYLVAAYTNFHAQTGIAKELKKICRTVSVCNVPGVEVSGSADVDVKVELRGNMPIAYVRPHAANLESAPGQFIKNLNRPKNAEPGKPWNLTDRADKPWQAVAFRAL